MLRLCRAMPPRSPHSSPAARRLIRVGAHPALLRRVHCRSPCWLPQACLWSGIGTDWKFLELPGHADRSATKEPRNRREARDRRSPASVNQSDDPAREYFADGLTQDIIDALGRFSGTDRDVVERRLPVQGKTRKPGRDRPPPRGALSGRRQRPPDRRSRAGDCATRRYANGQVLWSARFDEALADLFALQDKITTQIAGALAIRVTQIEQRRVFAKPTESLEAYDYVLRARPALQRPTRANIVEARALLRHAIAARPELRRRLCRARRNLLHCHVDGLGGIAGGIPRAAPRKWQTRR